VVIEKVLTHLDKKDSSVEPSRLPRCRAPPTLGAAMRMVASIGGFLGRNGDGDPGATVLWRGLDKLSFITDTFRLFHQAPPNGPLQFAQRCGHRQTSRANTRQQAAEQTEQQRINDAGDQ